jgi:hypothetical protein
MDRPALPRQKDSLVRAERRRKVGAADEALQQQDDRGPGNAEALEVARRRGQRLARRRRVIGEQHGAAACAGTVQDPPLGCAQPAAGPDREHTDTRVAPPPQRAGCERREVAARGADADDDDRPVALRPRLGQLLDESLDVGRLLVEAAETRGESEHFAPEIPGQRLEPGHDRSR